MRDRLLWRLWLLLRRLCGFSKIRPESRRACPDREDLGSNRLANLRGTVSEQVRQHRIHLRATSILLTHEQNLGHRVVDGTLRLRKRSQSIRRETGRLAGEMGVTAECSQVAEVSRGEADQIVAGSSSASSA